MNKLMILLTMLMSTLTYAATDCGCEKPSKKIELKVGHKYRVRDSVNATYDRTKVKYVEILRTFNPHYSHYSDPHFLGIFYLCDGTDLLGEWDRDGRAYKARESADDLVEEIPYGTLLP